MSSRIVAALIVALTIFGAITSALADSPAKPMNVLDHPRYKENPVYLFFEHYILDVIGQLPPEKSKSIQAMNLQKVFKTKSSEWHESLREALGLSGTIDIAILDLWYRNREIASAKGIEYPPQQFAMNFTDEYMKEGSQVDVWPAGALEAAKKRISEYRAKHSGR